jgi:predicted glycoside hydrolase/deacetylase ChbG (UPF0249 family)
MKYLIVNGDDFGAGYGINCGIEDAYKHGILTSASMMVNASHSAEAAKRSVDLPGLSVGLHVAFTNESGQLLVDPHDFDTCNAELHRQFALFQELMGRLPTHIDSHHNVHLGPQLLPHFLDLSQQYDLPLRKHSFIRYFSNFYGQWDGETHLEQIGTENLMQLLETEIQEGFTELACHPGYVDPDFQSIYSIERETELRTLCDPSILKRIKDLQIELIGFNQCYNCLTNASK